MDVKTTASHVAMIGDLVGSRSLASRADAQRSLVDALAVVEALVPARQVPSPTVGDEFQAVYPSVAEAVLAAVAIRLALPEPMDCRLGIGVGELEIVGRSDYGPTQDGSAWWSARDAIVEVKRRERQLPTMRTMIQWAEDSPGEESAVMNAYLMCRDHVVSGLDDRQRRLGLGLLQGKTQRELARAEGISDSAVSQSVRRSGLSLVIGSLEGWAR